MTEDEDLSRMVRNLNRIKAEQRRREALADEQATRTPPTGVPIRTVVFGSGKECDVRVTDDPYVSYRHCAISELPNGVVYVEDVGSINGTTVRLAGAPPTPGVPITGRTQIRPGMIVRIGRTDIPWRA